MGGWVDGWGEICSLCRARGRKPPVDLSGRRSAMGGAGIEICSMLLFFRDRPTQPYYSASASRHFVRLCRWCICKNQYHKAIRDDDWTTIGRTGFLRKKTQQPRSSLGRPIDRWANRECARKPSVRAGLNSIHSFMPVVYFHDCDS